MSKNKNLTRNLLLVSTAAILAACGTGSSSGGSPSGGDLPLSVSVAGPSEFPAGSNSALTVPVVVTNTGSSLQDNLNYKVINNTTGATLSINPQSLTNCSSLSAGNHCALSVNVPANSAPGTFTIQATRSSTSNSSGLFAKVVNSLSSEQTLQVNTNIGLTQVPASNGVGVDGVALYYNNSVSLPDNNAGEVVVTMVVNSPNAGPINSVELLDANNNLLPTTVLTGNVGNSGLTTLTNGSVVSLALTIPSGATQLSFKPRLLDSNGAVITNGNGTHLSTITVLRPGAPQQALLTMTPSNFSLSQSVTSQTVTVTNIGTATATLTKPTLNTPFSVGGNCGGSLAAGASCNYVVNFDASIAQAGTSPFTLNYNNAINNSSVASIYNYSGTNAVTNLVISSGANPSFNFQTTTAQIQTSLMTLTNAGSESIVIGTPSPDGHFTVNPTGDGNSCATDKVLAVGESCNYYIVYSNPTATPTQTSLLSIPYTYKNGASVGTSSVGLTYRTLQASASLSLSSANLNFGNILNNGYESQSQTITLINNGDGPTTTAPVISIAQQGIYSQTNNCNSILLSGESCTITTTAGPIPASTGAGTESNMLMVDYSPYYGAAQSTLTANLVTQVISAQSANLVVGESTTTGLAGGHGESANTAYQLQVESSATITYTITNIGAVPATNFTVSGSSPWMTSNTCTGVIESNGGSCSVTYTLASATKGDNNLNLNSVTMNWVDQAFPGGHGSTFAQNLIYVNGYDAPVITLNPYSVPVLVGGESIITATLSGGYQVQDQTISINTSPSAGAVVAKVGSCTVSSTAPTCDLIIASPAGSPQNDFPLPITNAGTVTVSPQFITANVSLQWINVGEANFSSTPVAEMVMTSNPSTGQQYVAFQDTTNSSAATVMTYKNGGWSLVGNKDFTTNGATYMSLTFDNESNLYIAYSDMGAANKASVMKYNGTIWSYVGESGFTTSGATFNSLAFNSNNQPYITFRDQANGNRISVMTYDGNNWNAVGSPGFSGLPVTDVSIAFNGSESTPYVAMYDGTAVGICKYNPSDSSWTNCSTSGTSVSGISSLVFYNGLGYLASVDISGQIHLATYNGTTWSIVSSVITGAQTTSVPSLIVDPSTQQPYVAYAMSVGGIAVQAYNGTTGWNNIGNTIVGSNLSYVREFLAIDPTTYFPSVSYFSAASMANVMYYPHATN